MCEFYDAIEWNECSSQMRKDGKWTHKHENSWKYLTKHPLKVVFQMMIRCTSVLQESFDQIIKSKHEVQDSKVKGEVSTWNVSTSVCSEKIRIAIECDCSIQWKGAFW